MRFVFALSLLALVACPSESNDPNGSSAADAGGGPEPAACTQRGYSSEITVGEDTLEITWPISRNGPAKPHMGATTNLPDLGCTPQERGESVASLMLACVSIFGPGETVVDLDVDVWTVTDTDPALRAPEASGRVVACSEITHADAELQGLLRSACEEQCDADGMAVIPDAPGGVPVVARVRTSDVDGNGEVDVLDRVELPYVDTWTHGIWLTTPAWGGESCADVECAEGSLCYQGVCVPEHTGFASFVAITEQSYASIPLVAGVGAGIEGSDDLLDGQGRGAIAGSVYDCSEGDGILGAAIGTTAVDRQTKVAYFTGDLPSPVLRSTDGDGVFAILNHAAGQTTLAAVMHKQWCTDAVDCACGGLSAEGLPADCTDQACLEAQMDGKTAELTLIGSNRIFVYPDSVTVASVRPGR
ncbi:MAG TPA: hypothetical protein DEB46_14400 [Myxococcales bacterium]|nr:hypothetical protein [Myxococcales bacterium]